MKATNLLNLLKFIKPLTDTKKDTADQLRDYLYITNSKAYKLYRGAIAAIIELDIDKDLEVAIAPSVMPMLTKAIGRPEATDTVEITSSSIKVAKVSIELPKREGIFPADIIENGNLVGYAEHALDDDGIANMLLGCECMLRVAKAFDAVKKGYTVQPLRRGFKFQKDEYTILLAGTILR